MLRTHCVCPCCVHVVPAYLAHPGYPLCMPIKQYNPTKSRALTPTSSIVGNGRQRGYPFYRDCRIQYLVSRNPSHARLVEPAEVFYNLFIGSGVSSVFDRTTIVSVGLEAALQNQMGVVKGQRFIAKAQWAYRSIKSCKKGSEYISQRTQVIKQN